MKRRVTCLVLISLLWGSMSAAQNELGRPFILNYTAKNYGAGPQNWALVQDSNGIIYVGNNSGVLEFDGVSWRKIPAANRSAVGSLDIDSSNIIYVGATGDFGCLRPDSIGQLRYVSFLPKLDARFHDFADIWSTHALDGKVYFESYKYLFCWTGDTVEAIKPDKLFHRSFKVNRRIYIRQRGVGLMTVEGNALKLIPGSDIFKDETIYMMAPCDSGRILIGSRKRDFIIYDGQSFKPFPTEIDSFMAKNVIYHGIRHDSMFIISSRRGGIAIMNLHGKRIRIIDKTSGLQDDKSNYTFVDARNGLWTALDNGVSRIEAFSPVTYFTEDLGLRGIVISTNRHQNTLYSTTGLGVYYLSVPAQGAASAQARFEPVNPLAIQCWHLLSAGGSLLAATSDGVFEINRDQAKPVRKEGGGFFLLRSGRDTTIVFAGLRDGLAALRRSNGKWLDLGRVKGVDVDGRAIAETPDGYLWIGTSFRGVARVDLRSADLSLLTADALKKSAFKTDHFSSESGLPFGGVFAFSVAGRILFGTEKGLYAFDPLTQRFHPDSSLGVTFADSAMSIDVIVEDHEKNIWLHSNTNNRSEIFHLIRQSDGHYRQETTPFLRFTDFSVLNIYPENDGVVWFSSADGLVRFDRHIKSEYTQSFPALIRKVFIRRDSLIYAGHGSLSARSIEYRDHSMRFECSASCYEQPSANQYQYFLEGLEDAWSGWTYESNKEYTNLKEGSYRFHVRTKNIFGTTGSEAAYAFEILPPWYRAWWAYIIYAALFLTAITGLIRWRALKLEREKQRLENTVIERTNDLRIKTEQLEKINSFVKTINSEIELVRLVQALLAQMKSVKGVERMTALAWDEQKQSFHCLSSDGWDPNRLSPNALTAEIIEHDYIRRSKEINQDIFIGPVSAEPDAAVSAVLPKSHLIMLIRRQNSVQACFLFENMSRANAFDDQDIELLYNLREHVTLAFMKSKLLEELKLLNEKKNEFMGIAAHDLRSPLNVITGFTSLLIEEIKSNSFNAAEGLRDLEDVLKAAKGMTHLLSELLDISAIESGKVILIKTPVTIGSIFDECERNHAKIAAQKNIALTFESSDMLPLVMADRVRIMEALDNLISNAIKYTFPGGSVRVYAQMQNDQISVSVNDTGQGLDDEDMKAIFNSFKKLSARPTGGESSTGLGLAIVKKIVEMHGGKVSVESAKSKGSTFHFTLNPADGDG